MLSTVAIEKPQHVSVTNLKAVSSGVTVCQLNSGEIVLTAHEGSNRVLVDLSYEELSGFAQRLSEFAEQSEAYQGKQPPTADIRQIASN